MAVTGWFAAMRDVCTGRSKAEILIFLCVSRPMRYWSLRENGGYFLTKITKKCILNKTKKESDWRDM